VYRKFGKRFFDLVLVIPGLILISPMLLLVAIVAKFKIGSPVLFQQERPGIHGKIFRMIKFRSMRNDRDANGELLPDEVRLVPFGKLLRATSLDEFPELWNVIKGEMSLVGPRPLLAKYLDRYNPTQARRHEVRPGITGWAQINGRNAITWEEKFDYDVWYVDNLSFFLDVKILALTVLKVFKRSGTSAEGHATMPEFLGTPTTNKQEGATIR
jgi:lipopolysaccharide/colanic/teichoic acid biosynthesis glycosyltransferase